MEDPAITRAAFECLHHCGLQVSIDDFGTGSSSLAALRRLPAAELKIDRAFVQDLASSEDARSIVRAVVRAIVQAIVQMAHPLQLRMVVEGVETRSGNRSAARRVAEVGLRRTAGLPCCQAHDGFGSGLVGRQRWHGRRADVQTFPVRPHRTSTAGRNDRHHALNRPT